MSMCLNSEVLEEHRHNTYCNLTGPKYSSAQSGQRQIGTDFRKVMIYRRYSTTFFLEETDMLGYNRQQLDFFSTSNVIHFLEMERC